MSAATTEISGAATTTNTTSNEPFSFSELFQAQTNSPPPENATLIKATDGVSLAVRSYFPNDDDNNKHETKAVLVFLHGGGAHSGAGYHLLGQKLSQEHNIVVHTPDIRGHGVSGGARGDSPSVEQVWQDVKTVLEYAHKQHPTLPLFLGGHSSGGGLVVNYASWADQQQKKEKKSTLPEVNGYLLLSPQLGYKSNTSRPIDPNRPEFARVNILAFIVNGIFGWMGHSKSAVRFNYPDKVLREDAGMVEFNTVNMANAITPESPLEQVEQMQKTLPMGLWVGENDEVFLPHKLVTFGRGGVMVPNQTHLGIIAEAHTLLGPWILDHLM